MNSNSGKKVGEITKLNCIDGTNIKNLTAKTPKNNTSGIKGVSWNKERKKWVAQIGFKGKNYNLGRYCSIEEAKDIRKVAENELFGNFLEWYKHNKKVRNK